MTFLGPLARTLAGAGLAFAVVGAAPAVAAPADVALLQSYIGDWSGRGTVTGERSEAVVCRLKVSTGNSDKVNYSGRCTIAGKVLSINGTLAYVEAQRRFEAAMTSNAAFSGIAVGQQRGKGLLFNLRERDADEAGKPYDISADIALDQDAISVGFSVVYVETGDSIRASVPFSK